MSNNLAQVSVIDASEWKRLRDIRLRALFTNPDAFGGKLESENLLTHCWIGGCWSDPKYRGKGAFRRLFDYLDKNSIAKGWERQGLGVWADNSEAIGAYRALGFDYAGELQPSERSPGRFYVHMVRNSK
ncbi:MAG: GNAT family N-acetyltransferase [Actinomycetes bacterium]